MLVTLMKAKLHRATVTQADLDYEGSIAIDRDLLDASNILPHEQVDVLNITTDAIGDPATCLMIAERATGKVVYRYNTATICARQLPSCEGPVAHGVKELLEETRKDGQPRRLSCSTTADQSRGVGWSSGVLPQ